MDKGQDGPTCSTSGVWDMDTMASPEVTHITDS